MHTGTAQQTQEQRFCLIVGMVGNQDKIRRLFGEYGIAGLTRRRLKTLTIDHNADPANFERYGEPVTGRLAKYRPVIGVGRQTMMDMHGGQLESQRLTQADQKVEQDGGVNSTGITQTEPSLRKQSGS
jgi:hypothetical protein